MDDYVTCGLVYGALFQAAQNSGHSGMIAYTRPRLQAVARYLQENKDNPIAKAKLREIAIRLEDEVRYKFVQRATDAITRNDSYALKASMNRVMTCDKAFGLATLPLPIGAPVSSKSTSFLDGFYKGCIEKQHSAPSPFNDHQLQNYCACMTDRAKSTGITELSSDSDVSNMVKSSNGACLASIR
jgi:hypothetical protein